MASNTIIHVRGKCGKVEHGILCYNLVAGKSEVVRAMLYDDPFINPLMIRWTVTVWPSES